ncbi:MAG: IS1595 family transposase [Hoeflea sp.]|nr:IS1595 family transposase [Hoeflea sp.]
MDAIRFDDISRDLEANASVEQCVELVDKLQLRLRNAVVEALTAVRSKAIADRKSCPHCSGMSVHRHGRDARGRQRFICVGETGCGRSFGVLQGTVFHRMRKPEVWLAYAERLLEGASLTRIKEDDIGICRHTAWRWRHRLLSAMAVEPQPALSGIIEVDETYFVKSFKGHRGWKRGQRPAERPPRYRGSGALLRGLSHEQVPILTAVDRSRNHFDMVLERRRKAAIVGNLLPIIERGSVICSDGYPAYKELASRLASVHHRIDFEAPTVEEKAAGLPRGRKGALSLGRINNWHEVMDTRFNRIHRGVSTKYLPHYLTLISNKYAEKLHPKAALQRAMGVSAGALP